MLTILLKLFQKVSYERQKQQSNNVVGYLKATFKANELWTKHTFAAKQKNHKCFIVKSMTLNDGITT